MSNFRPDTGGRRWSLVRVRLFSCAVGREGHCRQMSLACVGSTRSVPATLGLTHSRRMCSELHALPRPKLLRFRFSGTPQRRRLGWACVLCLPRPSSSGSQELVSALSPGAVCLTPQRSQPQFLGVLVWCPLCLFWGADFWL